MTDIDQVLFLVLLDLDPRHHVVQEAQTKWGGIQISDLRGGPVRYYTRTQVKKLMTKLEDGTDTEGKERVSRFLELFHEGMSTGIQTSGSAV